MNNIIYYETGYKYYLYPVSMYNIKYYFPILKKRVCSVFPFSNAHLGFQALMNEVGDETSAASILAGNANNWRGRAQQILSLQQKVVELQSKLSTTDVLGKEKSARKCICI